MPVTVPPISKKTKGRARGDLLPSQISPYKENVLFGEKKKREHQK